MLCAVLGMPVVADEGTELDDGGVILPAQGAVADGLEIGLEDLPELMPEDIGLDLDGDVALSGNLDLVGDGGTNSLPGEEERAGTKANDSSDFEIVDGVLVRYYGKGGDVVIPDGVTKIDKFAFSDCTSLTSVTIPNSVVSIGDYAFWECTSLTSVRIPNSVVSIGDYAFWGCTSLTSVTIPNSVTSIGDSVFQGCTSLTSVTIPNSVTSIGDYAFSDCTSLTSVTIPTSVKTIGNRAFVYCDSLLEINVSGGNLNYTSRDGILYSHNMKTLLQCPGGKKSVTIPNSVTSIEDGAFSGCEKLPSVTIPNSVTSIGEWAFCWCTSLPGVTIPNSVTKIGYRAFANCKKLKSAAVLSKKITLDEDVFYIEDRSPIVTLHITSGSNAIAWAKKNGIKYDIIKISDSALKLKTGQTHKLTVSGLKSSQITWSSSNKKVATVSGGKVKAVGAGKCTVSAKIVGGGTLKCTVTVTDPAKLSKTKLTISAVDSATIKLTGASGRKVTWTSSKSGVARIAKSNSGSVTVEGVKPGTAVIKAKIAGGKTLKCTVKVVAPIEMKTVKIVNELGKRMLHTRFTNRSGKKITYIKFDILQYDSRNHRLVSPYKDGFDLSATIKVHASTTKSVDVNGQTDHVKYSIEQVRFSDGTTWKP